jgi:hypothetical protein
VRKARKERVVADDLAAMGYGLTREGRSTYYVWSRSDDPNGPYPVLIGDLTLVMRFVITPEEDKRAIEDGAYRQLRAEVMGSEEE